MRPSTIMLCLVVVSALYVGGSAARALWLSLGEVGHRLACVTAQIDGQEAEEGGLACTKAKKPSERGLFAQSRAVQAS